MPEDTWKAIVASQYTPGKDAAQLLACSKWHEAAYDWRTVSFAMQTKARLQAKQAGRILYYIQAVDRVSQHVTEKELLRIVAEPDLSNTKKLPGLLPVYIRVDMMMQKTLLPPQYVTGTVGKLLGIELHPEEPKISNRQSVREAGCVILKYMPKWLLTQPTASSRATMLMLLSSARVSSPSSRTAERGPTARKTVSESLSHGRRSLCCQIKSPRCTAYKVRLLIRAWQLIGSSQRICRLKHCGWPTA